MTVYTWVRHTRSQAKRRKTPTYGDYCLDIPLSEAIVALLQRQEHTQTQDRPPPKFSLDVKSEDPMHTPRRHEKKRIIIYIRRISGERRTGFPTRSKK